MYKKHPILNLYVSDSIIFMNPKKAGEINQRKSSDGYVVISFNGAKYYVHRLMYETFIGEIKKGYQINHINGKKADNRLENLEVVSPSENIIHAYKNGLAKGLPAERNSQSKLSNENYYNIITDIINGYSNTEIAKKYNLHSRYISLIRGKKRLTTIWKQWEAENYLAINIPRSGDGSKFKLKDKLKIISELAEFTNSELAKKYNIDISNFNRIRSEKIWKDAWAIFKEKVQRPAAKRTLQVNNGNGNGECPF